MSKKISRRGTAALIVTASLLAVTLGSASQASAETLWACVKKDGSARIYTKKPKCKKKEKRISWNTVGPAGANGANGANGAPGKEGPGGKAGANGLNGAVAGFGAVQTSELSITEEPALKQVPGLSKALPAGSFVIAGNVEIDSLSEKELESVGALCEMIYTPSGGTATTQTGRFAAVTAPFTIIFFKVYAAQGEISFHMAVSSGKPATVGIFCSENGHGVKVTSISAVDGSLVAVQTSGNS